MYIAVDFDGTIVEHEFPGMGKAVPGAIDWLLRFQELGAKIILFTMRSDSLIYGAVLSQAAQYLADQGVQLYGINHNPDQDEWTDSPKAYAQIYIDDAAIGCPLTEGGARPYVDWGIVGPAVEARLLEDSKEESTVTCRVCSYASRLLFTGPCPRCGDVGDITRKIL